MDTKQLCFALANINATSGDELNACEQIKALVSPYIKMKVTNLSSLIGQINPDAKGLNILLDAHIDQVGLIVRGIDEKGFVLVDKLAGIDERVLVGSEVIVHAKKDLFGVVCSTPPHLSSGEKEPLKATTMAIDIGFDKKESQELVELGDRITFKPFSGELLGSNITSPTFDDRSAIAAIIKTLQLLDGKVKNTTISVQFSSQEEVGGSGAKTCTFTLNPDIAIAVDVGFGYNANCKKDETIILGDGGSIGLSPILNRELGKELVKIAEENELPIQYDIMSGRTGTNADQITINAAGVKTALISIPLRNMHTAIEVIDIDDIENIAELMAKYILKKDGEYCENA